MAARVQVATDVASLGIWDRDASQTGSLETLAGRGEAVIIEMGRDCGAAVATYPAFLISSSVMIR